MIETVITARPRDQDSAGAATAYFYQQQTAAPALEYMTLDELITDLRAAGIS